MEEEPLDKESKIIMNFEEFIESDSQDNVWMDINGIATVSGSTVSDVQNVIVNLDEFVKNEDGKFTTRRLYRAYTPFIYKFRDAFNGKIK